VCPRVGPDAVEKIKILPLLGIQPIVCPYTDGAIPTSWRISFQTIFVNSVSNEEISNVP
jgi:hypothetical protein